MRYSKFAQRFLVESGTTSLMTDLANAGDAIMLGGGNPAHITPVAIAFRESMQALMSKPGNFESVIGDYSDPAGDYDFRTLLADYLADKYGWSLSYKNIALTNGSQSVFGSLFNLFAGAMPEGDWRQVVLPVLPEYIGYADQQLGEQSLITARPPRLEQLDERYFRYRIDFDKLQLDAACGAVCVSRPTNPTGNVVSDDDIQRLAQEAKAAGVPLIIDGAYGLPFPGIVYSEASAYWDSNTILCLSLSKLGLPGLRTGIVVANEQLVEQLGRLNAIQTLAPGNMCAAIAAALLQQDRLDDLCRREIVPYYRAKRDFALQCIEHYMADFPLKLHKPDGAFFLWLWFAELPVTSAALYAQLRELGVLVIDGSHFYPGMPNIEESDFLFRHQQQCIRISYAAPREQLELGIQKIATLLKALYEKAG